MGAKRKARKEKYRAKREALKRMMNEVWGVGDNAPKALPPASGDNATTPGGTGNPSGQGSFSFVPRKCKTRHDGTHPVKIGGFDTYPAGTRDKLEFSIIKQMDYIICLNGSVPDLPFGTLFPLVDCTLRDFGGVPKEWDEMVHKIAEWIKAGAKVMYYCTGSHGRTGCLGSSLIAVMEPDVEDPIQAFRDRHCEEAIETLAQAEAIFKLKGVELPEKYKTEFKPKAYVYTGPAWGKTLPPPLPVHFPNTEGGRTIYNPQGTPINPPLKKNIGGSSSLVDSRSVSDDPRNHEDWCACDPCMKRVVDPGPCIGYDNLCACYDCALKYKIYLHSLDEAANNAAVCKNTKMDKDVCICANCVVDHAKKRETQMSRDHSHPITCDCDNCEEYYERMNVEAFACGMSMSSRFVN